MRVKRGFRDSLFVFGFGCVVSAAFMVAMPLGLLTLGGPLMAVAFFERPEKKGS